MVAFPRKRLSRALRPDAHHDRMDIAALAISAFALAQAPPSPPAPGSAFAAGCCRSAAGAAGAAAAGNAGLRAGACLPRRPASRGLPLGRRHPPDCRQPGPVAGRGPGLGRMARHRRGAGPGGPRRSARSRPPRAGPCLARAIPGRPAGAPRPRVIALLRRLPPRDRAIYARHLSVMSVFPPPPRCTTPWRR